MPTHTIPYLALIPYAAVALGLIVTLVLFVSLKWELQRNARRERKRVDELLGRLEAAAAPASPGREPVFVPVSPRAGINLNRRIHVQRLLRKGDTPAHIAAALGIPRAEVDLLIRVHGLRPDKEVEAVAARPAAAGS
jgi:uncharacterized protein (DUF2062 family)